MAKLVFRIICGEGKHTPQFDEQLRLVAADTTEDAYQKAVHLGQSGQETFENDRQQLVRWLFIDVSELYPLALIDGAELHSRINEVDDAYNYTELVHAKAEDIRQQKSLHLTPLH